MMELLELLLMPLELLDAVDAAARIARGTFRVIGRLLHGGAS